MYITEIPSKKASGKVFKTILLRKSFRENGKVKNKTIANLSCCNDDEINILKEFLNRKGKGAPIADSSIQAIPGKSLGSIVVLYEIAHRLGIVEALGTSFHGKLALWLIFARILEQHSRLSATRLDSKYDISSVINLERGFDENNLYDCLQWLDKNQADIENNLFHRKKKSKEFFWYDVTSSYFEGQFNELAAFGYNRDKKKQKRIVVIGLLCQEEGDPVSIEAFRGNTQDTQTFENQLIKLKNRFNCESITLISDRGLIRDKQKELLSQYNFHYITALPMTQIRPLLNQGVLKSDNFVDELKSLQHGDQRLIYRRNPVRAEETKNAREDRFQTVKDKVNQENERLNTALKASLAVSRKKIQSMIDKYELSTWVSVSRIKRKFVLNVNEEQLKEKSAFDGCYVWATDWKESELSNKEVYQHYKDLKYIEDDFRCFKTSFLEIRPIYVRTEASTRGHLLVIMLAHMILRELRKGWSQFNNTVEEILGELSLLCRTVVKIGEREISTIATPNSKATEFLKAVKVKMPTSLEEVNVPVVSRHQVRKNVNF
jgi:transposase